MSDVKMYIIIGTAILALLTSIPILIRGFYNIKYHQKYTNYFKCSFADEMVRKVNNENKIKERIKHENERVV